MWSSFCKLVCRVSISCDLSAVIFTLKPCERRLMQVTKNMFSVNTEHTAKGISTSRKRNCMSHTTACLTRSQVGCVCNHYPTLIAGMTRHACKVSIQLHISTCSVVSDTGSKTWGRQSHTLLDRTVSMTGADLVWVRRLWLCLSPTSITHSGTRWALSRNSVSISDMSAIKLLLALRRHVARVSCDSAAVIFHVIISLVARGFLLLASHGWCLLVCHRWYYVITVPISQYMGCVCLYCAYFTVLWVRVLPEADAWRGLALQALPWRLAGTLHIVWKYVHYSDIAFPVRKPTLAIVQSMYCSKREPHHFSSCLLGKPTCQFSINARTLLWRLAGIYI